MSFHLLHDYAIGSTIRPVSASRATTHLMRQRYQLHSRFYTSSSSKTKTSIRPVSYLKNCRSYPGRPLLGLAKLHIGASAKISRRLSLGYHEITFNTTLSSRPFSSNTNVSRVQETTRYDVTQEELRSLVDQHDTAASGEASIRKPNLQSADWENGVSAPTSEFYPLEHRSSDHEAQDIVREFNSALEQRDISHERLWEIYSSLPAPRACYITEFNLTRLLRRLQTVEYKSTPGMLRYLALISDMRNSGIGIPLHAWNSAISFAGRCLKRVTANEVESALRIWREMENVAKIQSNNITFNILFDVATKAGKFVLAEMILSEMSARKLTYTRHFRTSLIYYYGLRANGGNVRRAYSELIEAGEIVDTAVINCVIAALIKCGEGAAAHLIFERAKQLHKSKVDPSLPPSHWRKKRRLGKELDDAAQMLRDAKEHDEEFGSDTADHAALVRERTSVAPDVTTYKLLVNYNAVVLGDIDRTAELVDEMEQYEIAIHGSLFAYIFRAFMLHGGVLYTQWSRQRLENTWVAFKAALDAQLIDETSSDDSTISPQPDSIYEPASVKDDSLFFDTNDHIHRWTVAEGNDGTQNVATLHEDPSYNVSNTNSGSFGDHDRNVSTTSSNFVEGDQTEILHAPDLEDPNQLLDTAGGEPEIARLERDPRGAKSQPVVYIGPSMAEFIGRAFAKCTNLGRTAEVWAEIRNRWVPEVLDDVANVEAEVAASFPGNEELFTQLVERELRIAARRRS